MTVSVRRTARYPLVLTALAYALETPQHQRDGMLPVRRGSRGDREFHADSAANFAPRIAPMRRMRSEVSAETTRVSSRFSAHGRYGYNGHSGDVHASTC